MHVRPELRNASLILAFEGWNDAGEAATSALRFIDDAIASVPLADIDPEDFYDFTVQRPDVLVDENQERRIQWPTNAFRYGSVDADRELVTGIGVEPNFHWRGFCDCIVSLIRTLSLERVVLLGAYLADVVYSQPVTVTGFATEPQDLERLDVTRSSYQGPTGIVGVLGERLRSEGVAVVSLWAGLPHYINASPNPRGALALMLKLTQLLEFRVDEAPLRRMAADFEQKISQLVAGDAELSEYVRQLKRREFAQ